MRRIILLTVLITILLGCTSQEERKYHEEKLHEQQQKIEREKIISGLVIKYNISYIWKSKYDINEEYSIAFKSVIESHYQLISDIEIIDIYLKDSIEYVGIKVGFMPTIYFDFPITKEQEIKLLNRNSEFVFVVSIKEIRKIKFEITGEYDATVNLENSNDFIGKGQLIEIASTLK